MEGKRFGVLLVLLASQVVGAVLLGVMAGLFLVEVFLAVFLLVLTGIVVFSDRSSSLFGLVVAAVAFVVGVVNVVLLSFRVVSVWLVVLLLMSVTGFFLVLARLPPLQKRSRPHSRLVVRRSLLEKELPVEAPPRVVVYHDDSSRANRGGSSRRKKKAVKKKVARRGKSSQSSRK